MSPKARTNLTETMYYVLMSFWRQEMCGTDVTEFVEQKTGGRVKLGPGTLYVILAKFEEEGLIRETAVEGRKRTYQITNKGCQAFQEELDRLRTCILDGEEVLDGKISFAGHADQRTRRSELGGLA